MLKKIISGGQTGADQAALDMAIRFGFDHGGWIPKGRLTENGPLAAKYKLTETLSPEYPVRTRKNIQDADGTLIISRGMLTGGSLLTKNIAVELNKPVCHIDLAQVEDFEGAMALDSFISEYDIQTLNVAGPRLSQHPGICEDVKTMIEAALYLIYLEYYEAGFIRAGLEFDLFNISSLTVNDDTDIIQTLTETLTLKQRTAIARLDDKKIWALYFAMLDYVILKFRLDQNNAQMLDRLSRRYKHEGISQVEDLVMALVKELKQVLKDGYSLKVLK